MTARTVALLAAATSIACGSLLAIDDDDERTTPNAAGADASLADGAVVGDGGTSTTPVDPSDGRGARPRGKRIVFVTSAELPGSFGGLAAADAVCNAEANDAGVGGTFGAWLSIGSGAMVVDAKSRITGDAGWSLVDGGEVFASPSAIAAGSYPKLGIVTTVRGATVGGSVWTGTRETGDHYEGADCNAWTDATKAGVKGLVGATDPAWTAAASDYCNVPRRLICFEK